MIEEIPIDLGHGVSGVLTRAAHAGRRPALVLINAGFIHRSGPFRLHVELARELADHGITTLRIDRPGVGDAPARTEPDDARVVSQALDELARRTGLDRFIVGGLCSGADLAWNVAVADERVCGALLLDPLARPDAWFRLGQIRMLTARGLRGAIDAVRRRLQRPRAQGPVMRESDLRDWPSPGQERVQLARLVQRKVAVFALYTGGAAVYFTHPRQFAATFGEAARDPLVHFEYWPQCDHMFMLAQDRQRLKQTVVNWITVVAG